MACFGVVADRLADLRDHTFAFGIRRDYEPTCSSYELTVRRDELTIASLTPIHSQPPRCLRGLHDSETAYARGSCRRHRPGAIGDDRPRPTTRSRSGFRRQRSVGAICARCECRRQGQGTRRVGGQAIEVVASLASDRGDLELCASRPGLAVAAAARGLSRDAAVEFAEPNWIYTHQLASNDPYYTNGSLWGMYGDGTTSGQPVRQPGRRGVGRGNIGSAHVYVGIIDEGVMPPPRPRRERLDNPVDPPSTASTTTATATSTTSTAGTSTATTTPSTTARRTTTARTSPARSARSAATASASPA